MHFVTGGAFNGKARWVNSFYQLNEMPHLWISAYSGDVLPLNLGEWKDQNLIILEGIELYIKPWAVQNDLTDIRLKWQQLLKVWKQWAKDEKHTLILIGTDITKGIVPLNAEDRKWRDATGWAFQDIAEAAERIDLVWYGIHQKIK